MVRPLSPQKNYLLNIYYVLGTRYGVMNKLAWFLFSQLPVEWKRLLLNTEQLNYFKLWLSAPRKREVCSGDLGEGVQGHPHWGNGIWVVRTSQSGGCLEKNLPNGAIPCSETRVWGGVSVLELMKASVIMWLLPTWTLGEATGRQREATGNWEWGVLVNLRVGVTRVSIPSAVWLVCSSWWSPRLLYMWKSKEWLTCHKGTTHLLVTQWGHWKFGTPTSKGVRRTAAMLRWMCLSGQVLWPWSVLGIREGGSLGKSHSLVTGCRPKEEHLTYFTTSRSAGGLFELSLHLLGDILGFCETQGAFGGVKDVWLLTALEICGHPIYLEEPLTSKTEP